MPKATQESSKEIEAQVFLTTVCALTQIPRKGDRSHHSGGAHEEAPGLVRRQRERERGNRGQELYYGFFREGMGEAGKAGSGLASLKNFSRLWGKGAVPRCLGPGPGVNRVGGWWPRV